jgi:geranylgeranyl pyrophosphate synthase
MQELTGDVSLKDIEHTMEWKTATYSVLNPLCVGMVLAGAGCEDTDAIREYALHTGKAFQITDDIIGVFGTYEQTGKDVMDDIREGKQTLLTMYTFVHASAADVAFLRGCLANTKLTRAEFAACRRIIQDCGALDYAEKEAQKHVTSALNSLAKAPKTWQEAQVAFLRELAQSLVHRKN